DRGDGGRWYDLTSTPRTEKAQEGTAFWLGAPNSYMRNNVAANAYTMGYFYFNQGPGQSTGSQKAPVSQGADPSVSGHAITTDVDRMPVLEFTNNEAYGGIGRGLTLWSIGTNVQNTSPIGESLIKNYRSWKNMIAYYGYPAKNTTFDGLVVRADPN